MAPSTPSLPSVLLNDWLKPGAVVGALALLLAAFHGVRQEIRASEESLRRDLKADIAELRADNKADIAELRADYRDLRADYRTLNQKLDRVLESLLQP